jgi:1,4-alpha-glucan branching enzyme
MQEYHIDGFRFDQAKGFTQTQSSTEDAWAAYDASRVALWKNYNTYIKSLDPTFYVILEYFSVNKEESELTAQGMMTWTDLSTSAQQATMGYTSGPTWDLSGLFYDQYSFINPYGLVAYFESHDDERTMFKNETYGNASGSYTTKDIPTALKREEALAALLISSPGPKMLWEFEERGYDISIDNGGRLGDKPRIGNTMSDPNRHHLYATYSHLIKMENQKCGVSTTTYKYSLTGAIKWVALTGTDNNVVIAGNFDVVNQAATVTFPSTGNWYDNITGATINVPSTAYSLALAPGEYHVLVLQR